MNAANTSVQSIFSWQIDNTVYSNSQLKYMTFHRKN